MGVTRDATSGWYVPASAAEWTTLLAGTGVPNPTSCWQMQEASGTLADDFGVNPLSLVNSLDHQIAVPGWSRLGAGSLADGGVRYMGTANTFATSTLLLALIAVPAVPAALRTLLYANNNKIDFTTGGQYQAAREDGVGATTGTGSPGTTVHPAILKVDLTNGIARAYTDQETLPITVFSSFTNNLYFGGVVENSPEFSVVFAALWTASAAELADPLVAALINAIKTGPLVIATAALAPTFSIVVRGASSTGNNNVIATPGVGVGSGTSSSPWGAALPAPTPNSPAASDVITNAGTTIAALQAGNCAIKYVVAIEGYPCLLTDAIPAQAAQAWSDSDWTQAIGGLFVQLDNEQKLDPWEPFQGGGTCTLSVLPDSADRFGIDTHATATGPEALLVLPCDRIGTPSTMLVKTKNGTTQAVNTHLSGLYVDNGTDFVAGDAFIGTECVSITGPSTGNSNGMAVNARGKYSPFGSNGSGGSHFAQHHRITTDPQGALINPTVSQLPRTWLGRWVGVWMHTVNGAGVLNSRANAQKVFAGKIASIADDADTGCTKVELMHVLDVIKDTTIGRDMWSATITPSIFIATGQSFTFNDQIIGSAVLTANPLTVVASGASGTNQINAGSYSLEEIAAFLNSWLGAELAAARINGSYTWGSPVSSNLGPRTKCWWFIPGSASVGCGWGIGMPGQVFSYLGLDPKNPLEANQQIQGTGASNVCGSNYIFQGLYGPWRLVAFYAPPINNVDVIVMQVSNCIGTAQDQWALIPMQDQPSTAITALAPGLPWGCFLVNEKWLMVAALQQQDTAATLSYCFVQTYVVPGSQPGPQDLMSFSVMAGDPSDDGSSITVRQVYILEAGFSTMMKSLFYNSGTPGYNSSTGFIGGAVAPDGFDQLGYGLGLAIPGSLLGEPFETSCDNQPGWINATMCVIDEPTKMSDLMGADFVLRHTFPMWRSDGGTDGRGGITIGRWSTPVDSVAVAALTEANKAEPSTHTANFRTSTTLDASWQKQIIKIDYDRDFTVSASGTYQSSLTFEDETAIDDAGGGAEAKPFTISARNVYSINSSSDADMAVIMPAFLDILPMFTRPVRKVSRSINMQYWEGLHIGDIVLMDDAFMRDPASGTRGVSGREALVTRTRYTPGGLVAAGSMTQMAAEVDLVFSDTDRYGPYAPSAEVDTTYSLGHFVGGFDPLANQLRLLPHACSYTSEPEDWTYFPVGYVIRITQIDPPVPSAALTWNASVLAAFENTLQLDRALGGYDATKLYRVTFDHYTQIAPLQQGETFQASAQTGRIERVALPFEMVTTNEPDATQATVDMAELLPTVAIGDGYALDVGSERALIQTLNALIDSKTAHQSPVLLGPLSGALGGSQVGAWFATYVSPIFLGLDTITTSVARFLYVSPLWIPTNSATNGVRVTLSRNMPVQSTGSAAGSSNVSFLGLYDQAVWTETNPAIYSQGLPETGYEQPLAINVKDQNGMAWLTIEIAYPSSVYGLATCREGVRTDVSLR